MPVRECRVRLWGTSDAEALFRAVPSTGWKYYVLMDKRFSQSIHVLWGLVHQAARLPRLRVPTRLSQGQACGAVLKSAPCWICCHLVRHPHPGIKAQGKLNNFLHERLPHTRYPKLQGGQQANRSSSGGLKGSSFFPAQTACDASPPTTNTLHCGESPWRLAVTG